MCRASSTIRRLCRIGVALFTLHALVVSAESPDQERFQQKMERVQAGMQRWVGDGRDVEPVGKLLEEIPPLARSGRVADAEAVLDRALAMLDTPESASARARAALPSQGQIGPARAVRLTPIPAEAELIFHQDGQLWVMDRDGSHVTQITFGEARHYEHAALSYDHRLVIANVFEGDHSLLWLYDLEQGTEARLVPGFQHAGDGGVDWDRDGFVYFVGKETGSQRMKDLYRVRWDGSDLARLSDTPAEDECDPAVSPNRRTVTYCVLIPEPSRNTAHTEVWIRDLDGSNARRLYTGGEVWKASVHDPELSVDDRRVLMSRVNSEVAPNYRNNRAANTAHDIISVDTQSGAVTRLTKPGPIAMIPDIKGNLVVFTEISERDHYNGASIVSADGVDQTPRQIRSGANAAKWIP